MRDAPDVIARPPLILAFFLLAGLGLEWAWPLPLLPQTLQYVAGAVLISAGFGLLGWAITSFRRAGTNVPTNRPALALVVTGPYRFSRNPIYVGGTLAYLGLALAVDGVWLAALLAPFLLILRYGVIAREERYLEAKFGAAYRAYTQNVRRWL